MKYAKILGILMISALLTINIASAYVISRNKVLYNGTAYAQEASKLPTYNASKNTKVRIGGTSTTTTLPSSYTITRAQVTLFNDKHSTLESWCAQGGYDNCKRDVRGIFGLPGSKDVTLAGQFATSIQCFRDKGGYLEIDCTLFDCRRLADSNDTYITSNTSRIRIYPRNTTRFLGAGMW